MAWYNLPMINNFGSYPDPAGDYPKPDINILAPANTAFTAPASGVISSIDNSSFWGPSITVKFDTPPNSTAQYYAFNYMSSIANGLQVGDHVNTGQILAYGGGGSNNSGINTTAFALSAGPEYGQGTGWTQNVVGSWINPLLDPTSIINNLQNGSSNISTLSSTSSSSNNAPLSGSLFPSLFQILGLPSQTDLVDFFERMSLVTVGLMIILVGILIMFFSSEAGKEALKTGAEVAAA